jgi:hypothetical protein
MMQVEAETMCSSGKESFKQTPEIQIFPEGWWWQEGSGD